MWTDRAAINGDHLGAAGRVCIKCTGQQSLLGQLEVSRGEGVVRSVSAGVVEVGVPQDVAGTSFADLVLLQVVLARAFEPTPIAGRDNVDFILAQ